MPTRIIVCYFGNTIQRLNLALFMDNLGENQLKVKKIMALLKKRLRTKFLKKYYATFSLNQDYKDYL